MVVPVTGGDTGGLGARSVKGSGTREDVFSSKNRPVLRLLQARNPQIARRPTKASRLMTIPAIAPPESWLEWDDEAEEVRAGEAVSDCEELVEGCDVEVLGKTIDVLELGVNEDEGRSRSHA